MTNNILRFFLCLLLSTYVSCTIGAEVMPEEYIVKINNIEMRSSVAEKIFQYINTHEAKDTNILKVVKNMDVVIESDFMAIVSQWYQSCLRANDAGISNEDKVCTQPRINRGNGHVRLRLYVNKNTGQITNLMIL